MFNAMSPAQLTAVLSGVLREGADWSRPLDGFQRGQLKSASSIGRHLASELAGGPAVAAQFRADLRALLVDGPADTADDTQGAQPHGRSGAGKQQRGCARSSAEPAEAVAEAARRVVAAIDDDPSGDVAALGAPIGDLLTAARAAGTDDLATAVRGLLRDLVDAEIDLLSTPVNPSGGSR
ncbi:hypothetical protein PSU4_13950 [Pseudonocardia sulfidoxydans NBRC 16205]|uniref:Uncharacterized protein n=1 Tax=Pseudonocardia sulfidoxydans NBRC 16205 TaxID=1223511 RepID=A0A511DCB3_9PSEU|nr:hypothetical protein PSU4_13950 [Pseudonocardia sulfidoxydans NBRC 16205]